MLTRFYFILLLSIASSSYIAINAQELPIDPMVRAGQLKNGMRYFIQHNEKPEDRAELRLAIKAGSIQEDDDQLGIAHFVEHMAFNGTRHFEKNELIDYLESIGTRFGADLNAYTSFDETVYMLQARTDSIELLEKGLLILEDWANGLLFDPEEIDKERGVVISEWRTSLSPDQRMQQEYFPVLYKGSRYAERLPIGDPELIEKVDYATIRRFYEDWYRPDLMAIIAVGDFDIDWMEEKIMQRFGSIPSQSNGRERISYTVPEHKETLVSICTDPEAPFTQIQLKYKLPHQAVEDEQSYKVSLARSLYNSMLNARLFELQQSANPAFTFASSGYGSDIGNIDSYSNYAFVGEGKAIEGLEAVLTEARRAYLHGFTQTELDRKKSETLRNAEEAMKEEGKIPSASLAAACVYHFLKANPLANPTQRYELIKRLLPEISLETINALPKKWIRKENRVFILTGPEKEGHTLPTKQELLDLINRIDQLEVPAYIDEVIDEPLLPEIPNPGSIIQTISDEDLGITTLRLGNGINIWLKPTDFQNDEILMNAFSPGGHSVYSDDQYRNAFFSDMVVSSSGVGVFSSPALQKKLAGKSVNVGPYIGERYEGLSGNCSLEDLETLFQLVHLYFTAPRKEEEVLQSIQTRQKNIFQNILTNPYYYFAEEKNKLKYNNHPRRGILSPEEIDALNLDSIYSIYVDRFKDASDFTFVFVGNFSVEQITPYLSTYLGSLPHINRNENWMDIGADLASGKVEKTWNRGAAPKALVELVYHGEFEYYNSQNRYDFYSLIQLVRTKLRESLREDKGGVYGVRVNGFTGPHPKPRYRITFSFNAEPDRVNELIETAIQELQKIARDGVSDEDIQKIQETQIQNRVKSLKENGFWMGQIQARLQNGLEIKNINLDSYKKLVDGLDGDALQRAAIQYFGTDNFMKFLLLPEQK